MLSHERLGILNKMKNVKAVIFDWGGVCCKEGEPFASQALQETLRLNPDEILEKIQSIYRGYYVGDYTRDSFWKAVMKHFDLTENTDINPAALSDAYLHSYALYQDVLDLILELKKKFAIGLLSNLTPEMRDHIRTQYNLKNYFDQEVFSCDADVQSMKPDVRPFQVLLKKIGIVASECLFVDDTQKNIVVAASMGMKTLLFQNRTQFFEEIKKYSTP